MSASVFNKPNRLKELLILEKLVNLMAISPAQLKKEQKFFINFYKKWNKQRK